MEDLDPTAVAHRDHTTVHAARQVSIGLDVEHQGAVVAVEDVENMDALNAEEFISPRTP